MSAEPPNQREEYVFEMLAVLGLRPPVSVEDVKQAYLDKAKTAHPDRGGDMQQFIRLQQAFEQATEYAKFKAGRMQWLSGWVEQYAEQQDIIAAIQALGGSVDVESVGWLGQTIGTDFATVMDRLATVRLAGPAIKDEVFVPLAARLRRQSGLHCLELLDTRIGEAGVAELYLFENLRELDLSGTPLSMDDVEVLVHKLNRLEKLVVRNVGLGWAAKLKLRFSNRNLEIVT